MAAFGGRHALGGGVLVALVYWQVYNKDDFAA